MTRGWPPVVVAAYALGFTVYGVTRDAGRAGLYLVVVGTLYAIAAWADRHCGGFTPALRWAMVAWGALHYAGGLLPGPDDLDYLYNAWLVPPVLKYDQVVHAYCYAVATIGCWQFGGRRSAGIAALAAIGIGAVNESVEFLTTSLVPASQVGGFENMGFDLVFNAAGAAGAALWLAAASTPQSGCARHHRYPARWRSLG